MPQAPKLLIATDLEIHVAIEYKPSSDGYLLGACRLGISKRGADTLRGRWENELAARHEFKHDRVGLDRTRRAGSK
jgi:hypothetical protein